MENRRAVLLAALLGPSFLVQVFLAFHAGPAEPAAAPNFLAGFLTGLPTISMAALLYVAGRELGGPRR